MENNNSKQIKFGSLISYGMIAINVLLGLLYTPWILKEIGSSSYGLYTLASSLIALFLMDFGMSAAITRFVSNFRAQNNQDGINEFVSLAIKFYAIICSVVAIIVVVVYFNLSTIYSNLTVEELAKFKVVFVITAFFVVTCFPVNVCNGILNAHEQYILLKTSDVFNKIATVVVTIIALLLHGGLYALVFINGFFNLVTFMVKIFIIKKKTPVKVVFQKKGQVSFKEIFSFSAWSTINSMAQQLIFNFIPSILAMVSNTLVITMYGFANVIEGYVYTITQAINGLFMPRVSRQIVDKTDAKSILPLMIKVGRLNHSVVMLLLIGLTVLGKEFVYLWVGPDYSDLYYCILFLSWPYFIIASQQIAGTSIVVLNKLKYTTIVSLLAGIMNLVACYFVAGKYGVIGVCATTGLIFLIRTIWTNIIYVRILKINLLKFFKECHLKLLPALVITGGITYLIENFMPQCQRSIAGWGYFAVKVIGTILIYAVVMWLIGWNKYEKNLLLSFIPRRRNNK